jgi:hypothetical protein
MTATESLFAEAINDFCNKIGTERTCRWRRAMSAFGVAMERTIAECPLLTDAVEKRFCSSEWARLIQDRALMRNVDSKIHSLRFDCCVFIFYSLSAVTFSTASTQTGLGARALSAGECVVTELPVAAFEAAP